MAGKNILRNAQIGIARRVLIDCRNSAFLRDYRVRHYDLLTVEDNLASVRLVGTRYDLDERGFSRAVLTCEGVNFSGL